MTSATLQERLLRLSPVWVAVIAGALFALWSIVQNPVLNDDAYQYLRAAKMVARGDVGAMYAEYGWFHYSVFIAVLDLVLPGDELLAARVLNILLQSLLMAAFVMLAQRLHHGRRHAWLAALTLLAWPQLNELRFALVRDYGFWAFALWSLLLLLQYRDSKRVLHAALWLLALVAATAFRLEALLLAVVAPLSLLGREHRRQGLVLYALVLAAAVLAMLMCALLHIDLLGRMEFAYRYYLPQLFALPTQLKESALGLMPQLFTADNLPGTDNLGLGIAILICAYVGALAATLLNALSVPLSAVFLHAWWRGWWRPLAGCRTPVGIYALTTTASLLLFVTLMHFLTERYTTLLCLLLLLQVPVIATRWIEQAKAQGNALRYRVLAVFLIFYLFTDSLVSFGPGLDQLQQARAWLKQHPDTGNALLTNSPFLAYESGRIERYDDVRIYIKDLLTKLQSGNVVAVMMKASETGNRALLEQDSRLTLLERFANKRGDEVRVYQVSPTKEATP